MIRRVVDTTTMTTMAQREVMSMMKGIFWVRFLLKKFIARVIDLGVSPVPPSASSRYSAPSSSALLPFDRQPWLPDLDICDTMASTASLSCLIRWSMLAAMA